MHFKVDGFCFSAPYDLTFLHFNKSFHLSSHKIQKEDIVINKSMCIISCTFTKLKNLKGLPFKWSSGKESAFQCRGRRFDPWLGN